MAEIAWSSKEQRDPPPVQGCTIEKFMKMNPPTFSGATDPTIAENWVQETRFRDMFFDRYYPASVREARIQEFLSLSQGSLIVQQYAVRFIELSRFYPYIFPDEVKKARMATIAEESLSKEMETQSQRKRTASSSFQVGPNRGPWRGGRSGRGQKQMVEHRGIQGGQLPAICPRCERSHPSECRLGENVCFRCGRPSHMA
ncbi:uncharacterized protein LOC131151454 [Malania oleifera]|uniref:uncharacterized protein LOC131151454 n=1 Tax=Malania oleifera TaxID=397392 RepID=UPI0025AE1C3A|nr:uncharacterized protein LOC131151454 [Malania oleifera]